MNNFDEPTKESIENIEYIRNKLNNQVLVYLASAVLFLFISYNVMTSNSSNLCYNDWKSGPFKTLLSDVKSGGPKITNRSFYEVDIKKIIYTGFYFQHSVGIFKIPIFNTSKDYIYLAVIEDEKSEDKSIIALKSSKINPEEIESVKNFSGTIGNIESKIQIKIDSLDLGIAKNALLKFQIQDASAIGNLFVMLIVVAVIFSISVYLFWRSFFFYSKIETNQILTNFKNKQNCLESVRSELKQKSLKWIFPRTFLTKSFVVVDNIYDFNLFYINDITYLRKIPQGNNRCNLEIGTRSQALATINLDDSDLVFWENHIQKTIGSINPSTIQNPSTISIPSLRNDNQADELILKSKSMLSSGSSYNLGDLADICKKASELAFFEHHISFSKRKQIEKLYYACYNDLFNTDSNKTDTTDKLKEYFDGKILAINTFGIKSISWAIEEENISGDNIFKFAVQKRFSNVFPEYYEIITKNKEKYFVENTNKYFIESLIQEHHGVSPNSFNVLFHLVLSSNKTFYAIFGHNSNSIKSFIYNYQESYKIILSKSYGTDVLARNAFLAISLNDSIGNIATSITWFQNNRKKFSKENALGIFFYSIKGHETSKSLAIKSCSNVRNDDIEDLNNLLHFIAVWVVKNLSKQYFEEHYEDILALDMFKTDINSVLQSFDSTYQKWIETSNSNLNLGACILFKHFAGITEKSTLINSEDNNDLEYLLEISKSVDNMIIGVIEHFFYLAYSSITDEQI